MVTDPELKEPLRVGRVDPDPHPTTPREQRWPLHRDLIKEPGRARARRESRRRRGGAVEEISLDYDLGLHVGARERTGYDVLLWLEREVAAGRARPPAVMKVHSGNVAAIGRMEQAIEAIRRLSARS